MLYSYHCQTDDISIHALREEGDTNLRQPKPGMESFLSTPSVRRATNSGLLIPFFVDISIHALREEGDHYQSEPM